MKTIEEVQGIIKARLVTDRDFLDLVHFIETVEALIASGRVDLALKQLDYKKKILLNKVGK